jgi:hypothetical protein
MCDYELIKLPVKSRLREMSDAESKLFLDWVLSNQYKRIETLVSYINATSERYFGADFSPESLKPLGEWFAKKIELRPKGQEEIEREKEKLPEWVHYQIGDTALTPKTTSLIIDIAFYFSQVFLRNHPQITWEIHKGGKSNINYNQSVLTGFGKTHLNPIRILDVATGDLRSGDTDRLYELYTIWRKHLIEEPEKTSV